MQALFTILLGNPALAAARDAPAKTRFKMWWRLIGSAVENAAKLYDKKSDIDFARIFLAHEESEDEDSVGLAEALGAIAIKWPKGFYATDVAALINEDSYDLAAITLREFLYPGAPDRLIAAPRSVGKRLKAQIDGPVQCGDVILTLKARPMDTGPQRGSLQFYVDSRKN